MGTTWPDELDQVNAYGIQQYQIGLALIGDLFGVPSHSALSGRILVRCGFTQGVALGYRIRPQRGRNRRACVGRSVGGRSVVGELGLGGLVGNGPDRAG
jgi:hypothetical protein